MSTQKKKNVKEIMLDGVKISNLVTNDGKAASFKVSFNIEHNRTHGVMYDDIMLLCGNMADMKILSYAQSPLTDPNQTDLQLSDKEKKSIEKKKSQDKMRKVLDPPLPKLKPKPKKK